MIYQAEDGSTGSIECGCLYEGESGLMLYENRRQKSDEQVGYVPFDRLYRVEPSDKRTDD
ncbi:hypothetical protein J2751_001918 [Halorubrum alkaliphilum]|uniref:Uncharacterized protein n=1 Tax=Halorubrum alkaliphilum TaxID=261290 RepID=A0A8T4GII6_9EURY|nr:hypothetical protein [Halorubrum alkaliphilum]MBP1922902.1 hypothetical protein [Halorubrum alkaliphilum]